MSEENERLTEIEKNLAEITKLQMQTEFRAAQSTARHDAEIAEMREILKNSSEQLAYAIKVIRYLGDKSFETGERFKRIGDAATGEVNSRF